jgi:hypothetical protein
MPRTWSYRKIEHVELNQPGKGKMPLEGWIIFGIGTVAFIIFTGLAINICLHPVEIEVNESPSGPPTIAQNR